MISKRKLRPSSIPSEVFSDKFQASVLKLTTDLLATRGFTHRGMKGEAREAPVRDFFSVNLPGTFEVSTGEVIDPEGNTSPQLDLMIFDKIRNVPIIDGEKIILPAEALIASVEIKSKLNASEIKKSLTAAAKLKALKPFKQPVLEADRGPNSRPTECRYFHILFGYESDLQESNWMASELHRYETTADDLNINVAAIDRIYVANRGLIHPIKGWGVSERNDPGKALMHLYMNLLNYVVRENNNRDPVPFSQYSGSPTKGWSKIR